MRLEKKAIAESCPDPSDNHWLLLGPEARKIIQKAALNENILSFVDFALTANNIVSSM